MKPETEKKYRILTADESKWLVGTLDTLISEDGCIGKVSDGYHTFDELYHHRTLLFASVCNLQPDLAWKSRQHDDPNFPMYDGMFIAGIATKNGQATYHCENEYWDMFHVKELERAPAFDGHTPTQAVERIYAECSRLVKSRVVLDPDVSRIILNNETTVAIQNLKSAAMSKDFPDTLIINSDGPVVLTYDKVFNKLEISTTPEIEEAPLLTVHQANGYSVPNAQCVPDDEDLDPDD